ncbi:MAG: hypothetical protein RIQ44_580, partial [Actinomycetota bacterium]
MSNPINKAIDYLGWGRGEGQLPTAPAAPAAARSASSTRSLTPLRGSRRAGDVNEIVTFQPTGWEESKVIA